MKSLQHAILVCDPLSSDGKEANLVDFLQVDLQTCKPRNLQERGECLAVLHFQDVFVEIKVYGVAQVLFETEVVGRQSDLSRDEAGMEEGRHCVFCLRLVVCDLLYASINHFGSGVCVLNCNDIGIWVNRFPLEIRVSSLLSGEAN